MTQPTILLVDDEKANLKVLSELLKKDAHISLAISGQQAIDKSLVFRPDLILLDVVMPKMDGFETIKKLKAIKETSEIPIIFITGLNSADKEKLGLTLGAVDYIYKPFNSEVVKARVATQLKIIRQRNELQKLSQELAHASEIKSRFLANMSHEIRTPLTAVIGYAESILAGEIDEDEQYNAISIINDSGQHLLSLLNDILDISKVEADKLDVALIPTRLFKLIEEVKLLVGDKALHKGIEFNIKCQFPLPSKLITDPTRLKQILINLLNNAIKFTDQGFVDLVIKNTPPFLQFSIQDSGIGINSEDLSKLFIAFSQVNNTANSNVGGTGLGLNISKYLSEKLGGNISVLSKKGEGSCFTVKIKLKEADDSIWFKNQTDIDNAIVIPCNDAKPQKKLKGNILLAEDNKGLRTLFTLILTKLGLTVTIVEDGKQLVEAALVSEYDLIMTDIHMPNMGGVEAMNLIKLTGCETPFVALTANAMTHEITHYLDIGFSEYLSKPIQREKLVHVINHCLGINSRIDEIDIPENNLCQLKNDFLDDLSLDIKNIKNAFSHKNWQQLQFFAHGLNGSSAVFGFKEITKLAAKLENGLQTGEFPTDRLKMQLIIDNLTTTFFSLIKK
ncbi:response regulator [Pseudoalteromonas sp. NBT06-2]|uniref:response regulator n=1 Tax=Pseudoalteromonas sp. NBT06-2 TaxID=2025950 RepID=UPI0014821F98|nr:response regulator [Pseudoalteromonas sp. NBT06-2]